MENITINEIILATKGTLAVGNTDDVINSVSIDSRNIQENALFIPIMGENTDGHNYIQNAFDNGAKASLIEEKYDANNYNGGAIIKVQSTKKALRDLAKYYRNKFNISVVGVTGSVGKTTTKEMIASVLGETLDIIKTEKNYNGQLGLPLTIFNIEKHHNVAVLEMGVSEIGEMDKLADIAGADIGVITNIGLSHIENFKSVEVTCREKMKMIQKEGGTFFLNGDSPLLAKAHEYTDKEIVYYGINGDFPYKCEEIYSNGNNTNFTLVTNQFREQIQIPCLGLHNVYNALAAIAVAQKFDIHMDDIKKGLLKFKNVAMRQQISKIGDITLIDDSYNASPDSVKSSVSVLKNLSPNGRNIVVIADMLELGEHSQKIHYETGRYIALEGIDILITVGKDSAYLSNGAISANQKLKLIHFDGNKEAFEYLKNILSKNDKVLIKGSRGMHTDEIVNDLKNYYSNDLDFQPDSNIESSLNFN